MPVPPTAQAFELWSLPAAAPSTLTAYATAVAAEATASSALVAAVTALAAAAVVAAPGSSASSKPCVPTKCF